MSTSVKRRPKGATADSAKQRAVLDDVSRLLTEVTVRYYESLTHDRLSRLKRAIKLLRGKMMPMDVFLRWYPGNVVRESMAELVEQRLARIPGIKVTVVTKTGCGEPYHINSKKYAEEHAKSEIYCVMDDDQLPLRDNFFLMGMGALIENLDYGMVAGMPLEYLLAGQPYADMVEPLVEAHSIGCPYFVRKGTITKFPDAPLHFYDGELSKVITDQGLKTGLVRYAVYNHLGYGFSQVEHAKVG